MEVLLLLGGEETLLTGQLKCAVLASASAFWERGFMAQGLVYTPRSMQNNSLGSPVYPF